MLQTSRRNVQGPNTNPRHSYSIYKNNDEGESNNMEVKMEHDGDEEMESSFVNGMASTLTTKKSSNRRKPLICLIVIAFVIFLFAFIFGYLAFRATCQSCGDLQSDDSFSESYDGYDSEPEGHTLYFDDLKQMFQKYLNEGQELEKNIRWVSRKNHPSGSNEIKELAYDILEDFKKYKLDHTWADTHYVGLQFPNRTNPNSLRFVNGSGYTLETVMLEDPEVYSPYSAPGTATGGLVYANYGLKEDFLQLQRMNVSPKNQLVIVRVGKVNFAQKVANAEAAGALGVLIYPDPYDMRTDQGSQELPLGNAVYGHVHMGTGDPYTPGFPSFNHTQFPPILSSGLPKIPAQPISATTAYKLMNMMTGPDAPLDWIGNLLPSRYRLGTNFTGPNRQLQLTVNNIQGSIQIDNIFGCIEGRFEKDHYIVIGAQRDSWGPGAAKSAVGTAILIELARTFSLMVKNGFHLRRSVLFVSWDAGEFGSVGATEWLEGYLSMLHLKAAAYISLDNAVLGDKKFLAKSSPLFKNLIKDIITKVDSPKSAGQSIYDLVMSQGGDWESLVMSPLSIESGAYAFTAFGGVPAVEFSFAEESRVYPFLNTKLDTYEKLNLIVQGRLPAFAKSMAEVVGYMVMRLTHDHLLRLDYSCYSDEVAQRISSFNEYSKLLKDRGLTLKWMYTARGDYTRAAEKLKNAILSSDGKDDKMTRMFNIRIMRVEFYFLSQYVSVMESPFRHIIYGQGNHTLSALMDHMNLLKSRPSDFDEVLFRRQLALVTWTLQGAANALSGDVWDIDNNF
ncbi:transferrin receptor protein 2 isoform X2 [Ambystoma mexicanum]|uniref:transferrin receptor protein 2 isoform X2 n=1 Tax=Ambystoma mexicanum TaxID=8296 RepID=UPI0037E9A501